jgi:20S proteasome alpha/beta subunit
VYAGLGPDYRVLVKSARKSAQKYYQTYHEVEPVPMLVRDTANICQEYTQSGGKFVVSVILFENRSQVCVILFTFRCATIWRFIVGCWLR